jgi:hypothetical protein
MNMKTKSNFINVFLLTVSVLLPLTAQAQFNLKKIKEKAKEAITDTKKQAQGKTSGGVSAPESNDSGGSPRDNWGEYKNQVIEQINNAKREFAANGTVESSVLDKTAYATDDDAGKWFMNLNYANDAAVQKEAKERLLGMFNIYNPNSEAQNIPPTVLREIEAAAEDFRVAVTKAGAANKFSETKPSTANKEADHVKAYLAGVKNTVLKVVEKKSWEIYKNELGIPNYRQKTLVVHYQPAGANYCVERGAVVRENYAGGGIYETTNPDVVMWGFAKLVGCK